MKATGLSFLGNVTKGSAAESGRYSKIRPKSSMNFKSVFNNKK